LPKVKNHTQHEVCCGKPIQGLDDPIGHGCWSEALR
jgi:hypothetical protein